MSQGIKKAWTDVVQPLFTRPRLLQVAALCLRGTGDDVQVLMITSRGTGRWIIPKGWPIENKTSHEAALTEAWEEAGVKKAKADPIPFGSYTYDKILDSGAPAPVEVQVYLVQVEKLMDSYPEVKERRRKWMSPERAAELVAEPKLKDILRRL
ncbi:8-oxo-dGTP pyrophosphatase MutT, NUDIX family [Thalassovita litoralis]|jgi:8-oxo-dGTP pyrophosphatase MutT (NUDIX family)|uniref:8-oxo-dGTP pyrophosphatase MutT, NUDIX family n=1 Tax=Thalassovita litoralis TaxID=1010611 RepID=A0A521D5R5_9RHOB|nr:NUDIX hydrolase [Thalassovita litoralis]SMO67019.1 8-oxo-dGTP pyrophosphatase MutT, NUDIX family [Thalassovita litoralis]